MSVSNYELIPANGDHPYLEVIRNLRALNLSGFIEIYDKFIVLMFTNPDGDTYMFGKFDDEPYQNQHDVDSDYEALIEYLSKLTDVESVKYITDTLFGLDKSALENEDVKQFLKDTRVLDVLLNEYLIGSGEFEVYNDGVHGWLVELDTESIDVRLHVTGDSQSEPMKVLRGILKSHGGGFTDVDFVIEGLNDIYNRSKELNQI